MLLTLSGCDSCSLKKQWPWLHNPRIPIIPPKIYGEERIVCIGEGPGETEDIENSVFVGSTGQLLRSTIPQPWVDKIYWGNTIRCRPPENRAPKLEEIACCSEYLEADLETIKPHAILGIGGVALDYFWADQQITAARGVPFPSQMSDGSWIWVYTTFHPSYVARGARKDGVNPVLPIFKTDLQKFFNKFPQLLTPPTPPPIPPSSEVCYPRSLEEVRSLFGRLKWPFGYDIETSRLKPYQRDARILTTAFSDGVTHFAFPVAWPGQLFNWGEEALGWCLSQNGEFIAHNAPFELAWNWWTYPGCDLTCAYQDTMAKARVHYERKSLLSLDDQTRIHVGVEIKSITKVDSSKISSYPLEQVLYYNALDAWGCWVVNKEIQLTPIQQENYDRIIRVQRSNVTMELLGLPVDLAVSSQLKEELSKKQEAIRAETLTLPETQTFTRERGKEFSISSPIDVGAVLVSYCGLKLPKTEKGNYSSAEDSLKDLSGKHPLVDLTLDYREIAKLNSTYVEPIMNGRQLGVDGLIHSCYSATLTATSRLCSQEPNIQNWPVRRHKEVRKQVVAPPGFIIVSADYGQVEARVVAMAARDWKLIKNFVDHVDIHTRWLERLVKLYPKYLELKAKTSGEKEEKKIWKAARQAIKTDFVFSSLYGSIAPSISHATMVPLSICEQFHAEFWGEYKAVKTWIDGQFAYYQQNGCVELLSGLVRNELLSGQEPINTVAQGTGTGSIPLAAQAAIWELAIGSKDFNLFPRINVHDSIEFIMLDDSDLEKRIDIVGKEMVKPRFDFSICPLTAEFKVGYNWYEMEEIGVWEGDYVKT